MGKILDLSVFEEETLDIRLPEDGSIVRIKKPSQRLVIEMLKFKELGENTPAEQVMEAVNKIVVKILNSNDANKFIDIKYVEDMNLKMKLAIIKAYSEFITGVQSNPN